MAHSDKSATKRIAASVKASLAAEGLTPSKAAQAIGKDYLDGKISGEEAGKRIKALHQQNFGK